ncbi:alpha/beta fold hydrolase [Shewanella litorisediminis]|uniref:Alpha/beta fold hydrolase n=1 Tax=Shewanella litorisediminis TaxID=1173586 RepID=A0ABX7FZE9_9GAMM|nr:alpha/beta fold hydrolase [Shewanella litorisediminis]MCL2919542.1 alpha/beta hydrolase [Shewanella litorisediminis]QRH00422.1 alpha/beta fold hydrolase [Shewanella litorisediminis]
MSVSAKLPNASGVKTLLPQMIAQKLSFILPLDYQDPAKGTIEVFARSLVHKDKQHQDLPWLVYFQGGPGFAAQRPVSHSGWIKRALAEYRVLLLDQRGTGLSTPVNATSLAHLDDVAKADYLTHFRADNIIRDAEAIRAILSPETPWTILGQSFGGFCVLRYLSVAAHGLKEAYITGGIPPIGRSADEVYRATFKRVLQKNRQFHQRFPDAASLLAALQQHLLHHQVLLPSGQRLTPPMLQLLGIHLGMEDGPEAVYYLIEQALLSTPSGERINPLFVERFGQMLDYNTNPLFSVLHEAIYCEMQPSNWAAHRIRAEYPQFDAAPPAPLLLTGEMIFPWMFDCFEHLKPLKGCAELLAQKTDWPRLYDTAALATNTVPVASAIYSEDMFVEMEYSLETAKQVANLKYWLTSEYEHNGIRMDGERILDRLIAINRGTSLR